MSLREREKDWQRRRRFPAWDQAGGPGRAVRWTYRHPGVTTLLMVGILAGMHALLSFAQGGDVLTGVQVRYLLAGGFMYWYLRVAGELYEEWREGGREQARTGGSRGSWLDRADRRNQAAAEAENEFGVEEMMSPGFSRFFGIWYAYIGLGVLVGLIVTVVVD